MLRPGAPVDVGQQLGGRDGLAEPFEHVEGRPVGLAGLARPGALAAPDRRGSCAGPSAATGARGTAGPLALGPRPPERLVVVRLRRTRSPTGSAASRTAIERGHQHLVLGDVVGPRRRGAHEEVLGRRARRPGRHGLAPQDRARARRRCSARAWLCIDVASERMARRHRRRGAWSASGELAIVVPTNWFTTLTVRPEDGVDRLGHGERARQAIPDVEERLALAVVGCAVVALGVGRPRRAQTASSTPSTSRMVRWASACSGGSRCWATVR